MRQVLLFAAVIAAVVSPLGAKAQSDAQFSQYYQVKSYYNPAATGTDDFLNIRGGGRLQWLGIDNAPKSFAATGEMPFKAFGKRFGTGLVLQQESYGLYRNLSLGAQISYRIKLFGGFLSPGLQVGFINQTFKGSEVNIPDDDDYHQSSDDAIPRQDLTGYALDLAAGVFYVRGPLWTGLSMTHLNQPVVTLNSDSGGEGAQEKNYEFTMGRTLYFMAGYNIAIKNTLFEVIPSVFVKTDFRFTTGELTARLRYNKFLTAGLGYRYNDAVSISLAAEVKNFYLGYSYDYPVSAIAKASSGSHEIWVGYRLKLDFSEKNKNKHKSIRLM